MDWTSGARDSLTLQGDVYGSAAGQKLGISSFSPPALSNVEENAGMYGQNVMGAWSRKLSGGSDVQIRAYYDRTDRQDLNYREIRNTFDFDFIHHKPYDRHDIIWGAGLRISPSRYFQTVPTVDFPPHEQTYSVYSGFIQDDIALVRDRLSFTVGTKVERNSFSGFEIQPSGRLAWTPDASTHFGHPSPGPYARHPASRTDSSSTFWRSRLRRCISVWSAMASSRRSRCWATSSAFGTISGRADSSTYPHSLTATTDLLSVDSRAAFVETSPSPAHLVLPLYLETA